MANTANINAVIGNNIRQLRIKQGISLRKFALMIGIDSAHLSRIERGLVDSYVLTIGKIADGLGVDIAYLMTPHPDN